MNNTTSLAVRISMSKQSKLFITKLLPLHTSDFNFNFHALLICKCYVLRAWRVVLSADTAGHSVQSDRTAEGQKKQREGGL